jgi:hypothetical protein
MPHWMATGLRWWRGAEVERWAQRTVSDELASIQDQQLRAVLGARWGDYGATPLDAPFVEHAIVTGSYNGGAWFPVGGPSRFAQTLVPVIEAAGGQVRTGADVQRIVVDGGRAVGVDVGGMVERAGHVISAMGAGNTVARLPGRGRAGPVRVVPVAEGPAVPRQAHGRTGGALRRRRLCAVDEAARRPARRRLPGLQGLGRGPAAVAVQAPLPGAGAAAALSRAVHAADAAPLRAFARRRHVRHRDERAAPHRPRAVRTPVAAGQDVASPGIQGAPWRRPRWMPRCCGSWGPEVQQQAVDGLLQAVEAGVPVQLRVHVERALDLDLHRVPAARGWPEARMISTPLNGSLRATL